MNKVRSINLKILMLTLGLVLATGSVVGAEAGQTSQVPHRGEGFKTGGGYASSG